MPRSATYAGLAGGVLCVVLAGCGSVKDPNRGAPDGGVDGAVDGAVAPIARSDGGGMVAPPDAPPPTFMGGPALPFWTASGGGSGSVGTTQLGVSIGGIAGPEPLVAPGGARLTIGVFGEITR